MTHFLVTEEKPDGFKLEEILSIIRADIIKRANKITDDHRPEAIKVLENNIKILGLLTECINLSEESTNLLLRAFGPSREGEPRIGRA